MRFVNRKDSFLSFSAIFFAIFCILANSWVEGAIENEPEENKNIILIGWGGVQRDHLWELIKDGKLKNVNSLIESGRYMDIHVDGVKKTLSKPCWAQVLTGYGPNITNVYENARYNSIPKGYTIFERVKDHLGEINIKTALIGASKHNLGVRGRHRICLNCQRNVGGLWWDEDGSRVASSPSESVEKDAWDGSKVKIFREMEAEPYFNAYKSGSIDIYDTGLGKADNVGKKVLEDLEKVKDHRFFFFVQFNDADTAGHYYGENSDEYSTGIILEDEWLGRIISKLKELNIFYKTSIFLVTNYGFEEGGKDHWHEPDVWLVTNDARVKKDHGK